MDSKRERDSVFKRGLEGKNREENFFLSAKKANKPKRVGYHQ